MIRIHGQMHVEGLHDEASGTMSYIVLDRTTRQCALIDSVLDYDPKSGRTATARADRMAARVRQLGGRVQWLLETHVHTDHLSAAPYLRLLCGGKVGIGSRIVEVQSTFGRLFNAGPGFARDGSQFDHLFQDGEHFMIGTLPAIALHTPGHTPACTTYLVGDGQAKAVFVGDTLLMPDYGTARCDLPGGDARTLYRSIRKLYELPPSTCLYMGHDFRPRGRRLRYASTVEEERNCNVHVREDIGEDEFVATRTARDATLPTPMLMLASVQVNMRAGYFPEPEDNGTRYLKIPLDAF